METTDPTPQTEAQIEFLKITTILVIAAMHRKFGGWPVRGDLLYEEFRRHTKPPFAFQDERSFATILSDLIDAGLVIERTGKTRTSKLDDLEFCPSRFTLGLIAAVEKKTPSCGNEPD